MVKETWLSSIKKAFEALNGEGEYSELYPEVEKVRLREGLPLTKAWKATVRRTIEDHSQDSKNFRGENVFVKFGSGHWGLINDNMENMQSGRFPSVEEYRLINDKNMENMQSDDDESYIDGLYKERLQSLKSRNQSLVLKRKEKDNFKCQSCGFCYKRKIVESHHIKPLSERDDIVYSSIDDLVTLCPTCHSLAHYLLKEDDRFQQVEYLLEELKKIVKKS